MRLNQIVHDDITIKGTFSPYDCIQARQESRLFVAHTLLGRLSAVGDCVLINPEANRCKPYVSGEVLACFGMPGTQDALSCMPSS